MPKSLSKGSQRETHYMKQALSVQPAETADYVSPCSSDIVACPCCGSTSLSVRDVEYGPAHVKGIQRYIFCGWCGAFNGVNLKRAGGFEKPVTQAAEEIGICIATQQERR